MDKPPFNYATECNLAQQILEKADRNELFSMEQRAVFYCTFYNLFTSLSGKQNTENSKQIFDMLETHLNKNLDMWNELTRKSMRVIIHYLKRIMESPGSILKSDKYPTICKFLK